MMQTYQTRFGVDEEADKILEYYACLFSMTERKLYSEVSKGKTTASCKNDFLKQYGITARQFNACRVSLEGKIAACRAGQVQTVATLKQQIKLLEQQISRLEKNQPTLLYIKKNAVCQNFPVVYSN